MYNKPDEKKGDQAMKTTSISILAFVVVLCLNGIGWADLVDISVATDKPTYLVGEEVIVYVSAYNPGEDPITLSFVSSLQATYWMDESYYWHINETITPSTSYVMVNAHSTYTWELTHNVDKMSDYPLFVGEHNVNGYVLALELQENMTLF